MTLREATWGVAPDVILRWEKRSYGIMIVLIFTYES